MKDNEIMNIETFTEEVHTMIKLFLPNEYDEAEISVNEVIKNNDTRKIGLTIRKNEEEKISPTIYLDDLYEKYKEGMTMEEILTTIARLRVDAEKEEFDVNEITSEEYIRENLGAILLNRENNKELLKQYVWEPFLNLAIVYKVNVKAPETGEASYKLSNEAFENTSITRNELSKIAFKNMHKTNEPVFKSMTEVLSEIMGAPLETVDENNIMSVLSNTTKVHGAIWMADKRVMNAILKTLQVDTVAVLPSSIHEVIIVKEDAKNYDELVNMVKEVNETQVSEQERLADCIYIYNRETGWAVYD